MGCVLLDKFAERYSFDLQTYEARYDRMPIVGVVGKLKQRVLD